MNKKIVCLARLNEFKKNYVNVGQRRELVVGGTHFWYWIQLF